MIGIKNQREVLFEDCVKEIITKEDERYKLVSVSLLSSKADIIKHISKRNDLRQIKEKSSFSELRNKIIEVLYSEYVTAQKIDSFISDEALFKDWIIRISKDILKRLRLRSNPSETIDKDLDPSPYTIAFIASLTFLCELIDWNKYQSRTFNTPESIESDLSSVYARKYPINLDKFLELLKKDDADLWKVFRYVIYKITDVVAYKYLYKLNNKDDLRSEAWMRSNEKIYDLILSNNIPNFETGIHLRNYIWRISVNNLANLVKKKNIVNNHIEDMNDIDKMLSSDWGEPTSGDFSFFDIDINNQEDIKLGLVNVLFNKPDGIYESIAKGIDDKIDILLQHTDGKSYKELAENIYGSNLSLKEQKQCEDNLRQGVSRAKKTLVDRFKDLINKKLGDGKR